MDLRRDRIRTRFLVAVVAALSIAGVGYYTPAPTKATAPSPIRYTYDAAGRISSVIDPAVGSGAYHYDAAGNITSITRAAATAVLITEFAPDAGPVGTTVAIDGTGFSTTPSQNAVTFNGTAATVTSATDTELKVTVPSGATSGTIGLTTPGGSTTSATSFAVGATGPVISGFSPAIAAIGDTLTISGSNFESNGMADSVIISGSRAAPTTATTAQLTVVTPVAGAGHVVVATPNGTATSTSYLWVAPTPYLATNVDWTGVINDQTPQTVTVSHANKIALMAFEGTGGQRISLDLTAGSVVQDFTILKPDGSVLAGPFGVNGSLFMDVTVLPTTGTYTVVMVPRGGATGSQTFRLYTVPADTSQTITADGTALIATNTVPGQNMAVSFTGTLNQRISLDLSAGTVLHDLTIKKPDGSILAGPVGVNGAFFVDLLVLPVAGTYTIYLDPRGNAIGSQTLKLYTVPADQSGTITAGGAAVVATNTVPGQNMFRTFTGTLNQRISLDMTAGTITSDVTIKKPDGTALVGPVGVSTSWSSGTLTLPVAGTYTIYVDPRGNAVGSHTLKLNNVIGLAPNVIGADLASYATSPAPVTPTGVGGGTQYAPPLNSGPEDWRPTIGSDWRTGRKHSPWEDQAPLRGPAGTTALSGTVLNLAGNPMAGVTLTIKGHVAITDATGRFLLSGIDPGRNQMHIDGTTANKPGRTYGTFEVGVDVVSLETNVLPYTIWMPKLDTANMVTIPATITKELVITTPFIPGLELHIPAGSKIVDEAGKPVTEIGITPIPVDRPPFFLPKNVSVPIYFTIQPGGAYIQPAGGWLVYPNYNHKAPGTRIEFWHYDPDVKDWFIYGDGSVTTDGRQVRPDAGVRIWDFAGSMIGGGLLPAMVGWTPGGGRDGDPVDLASGLFLLRKTDLIEPGLAPLILTRTYRQSDNTSRAFGIGADFTYSLSLYSAHQYTEADLILPGSGRIHYVRTSPGTGFVDAVFTSTATPTAFYGSTIRWNGGGWDLRMNDGTVYVFGENAPLQSIRDRYGNTTTITRVGGATGNIVRASSTSGRWLSFTYDTSNRIISAADNIGRTVGYQYDATGRLWKVTDPAGGVTEYTYNASNQMTALKDARGITFLQNQYDANGRVSLQTQADSTTYQFAYTTDGNGNVTQTDVTDPRGFVRRVTFNGGGYPLTDTSAFGQSIQQTVTFVRQASGNFPTSATDALGRRTDSVYDTFGNLSSVTRLAGTSSAVTTTMTYESAFQQIASITDPMNHTTLFRYDAAGNLAKVTDPRGKDTTFTYDVAGQTLTTTDATGKVTHFAYLLSDLIAVTDPLGRLTSRFVDAAGRSSSTSNPLGEVSRIDFDVLNRPTRTVDALGNATAFTYDPNGNLITVMDPRSGVTNYTYDSMDRVATRRDPLLHTETLAYDGSGNPTSATDRKGQVTAATYDALGRRTFVGFNAVTNGGNTTYDSSITATFDAGNRATQLVDTSAGTITYVYDGLDRLTSETTPQGSVTYGYDGAGRRTRMTLAGQPDVTYGYDLANRVTGITQSTTTVGFMYDDAGRQLTLTLPNGIVGTYGYNDASELTSITYAQGPTTVGDLAYTYDLAGRRATIAGSLARTGLPTALGAATYNADNQLTARDGATLTYDLNGSMLSDGTRAYSWNARNQLTQIAIGSTTVGSFTYDAVGRRIARTITGTATTYAFDGTSPIQEQSSGAPTANMITDGRRIFSRSDAAGARSFLRDAARNTVALTDATGTVSTSYTYDPSGVTTTAGSSSANPAQFKGAPNDGPTGLYFDGSRYYDPVFGQYISEDALGSALVAGAAVPDFMSATGALGRASGLTTGVAPGPVSNGHNPVQPTVGPVANGYQEVGPVSVGHRKEPSQGRGGGNGNGGPGRGTSGGPGNGSPAGGPGNTGGTCVRAIIASAFIFMAFAELDFALAFVLFWAPEAHALPPVQALDLIAIGGTFGAVGGVTYGLTHQC